LVDTRAPLGTTGALLLDPTDIMISTAANTPTLAFGAGTFSDSTTAASNLNVTTLTGQLGLSNVIVTTASPLAGNGDITVNNAINYNSANTLTLSASRNITVVAGSGGINNAGSGALTLTGGGAGSIDISESITTNGGTISLASGTGGINLASAKSVNAGSGLITMNAGGGAVNLNAGTLQSSNATAAAITIANAAALTLGNVALTGGGTFGVTQYRRRHPDRRHQHQRHGRAHQGRRGHADLIASQHVYRHDDDQWGHSELDRRQGNCGHGRSRPCQCRQCQPYRCCRGDNRQSVGRRRRGRQCCAQRDADNRRCR
jgi:hypothetical protein